ncbi:MAG: CtsR family transcriptional regulator [Firmicutes bacterium]|jgi:transcriptional regulator CtsR|nr:CtsR family transcriptional regulator [Bacillota bacterium]
MKVKNTDNQLGVALISSLSDHIERYIKALLDQAGQNGLEIRRIELAELFECVPSQINYVLKTRFSNERGYIVESRRGGGGYIRILRLEPRHQQGICPWIYETVGESIDTSEAEALLARLLDYDYLTKRDVVVIRALLEEETRQISEAYADRLRAMLLRSMLMLLLHGS